MDSQDRPAIHRNTLASLHIDDAPSSSDSEATLPFPNLTPTALSRPAFPPAPTHFTLPSVRVFLPSFLTHDNSVRPRRHDDRKSTLAPTAWVDGLRGIAALLVLIFHFSYRMANINLAWGANRLPESYTLWRLPVVRLLSSGSAMVALFFLISGYALSYRPLQLVRAAQKSPDTTPQAHFTTHLASAILRRPIRLFLPVIFSSLLIFLLLRLGIYDLTRPIAENTTIYPITPQETHVEYKHSLFTQLHHWYTNLSDLTHNAFGDNFFGGNFEYDQHMWTIPVELRSSFTLFLALVPTIALRDRMRLYYWIALIAWSTDGGKYEMILFYTGALIADWDLARLDAPTPTDTHATHAPETPLLAILSLLMLSYPEDRAAHTPLYHYLAAVTPGWFAQDFRFWQVLGGAVLFATIAQSRSLKRPLESRAVQFLGRISYGLYLMHGPVIHTVGFGVMGAVHGRGWVGYVVGLGATAVVAIWAGDVWTREVDGRCVRWARRFSEAVLRR